MEQSYIDSSGLSSLHIAIILSYSAMQGNKSEGKILENSDLCLYKYKSNEKINSSPTAIFTVFYPNSHYTMYSQTWQQRPHREDRKVVYTGMWSLKVKFFLKSDSGTNKIGLLFTGGPSSKMVISTGLNVFWLNILHKLSALTIFLRYRFFLKWIFCES